MSLPNSAGVRCRQPCTVGGIIASLSLSRRIGVAQRRVGAARSLLEQLGRLISHGEQAPPVDMQVHFEGHPRSPPTSMHSRSDNQSSRPPFVRSPSSLLGRVDRDLRLGRGNMEDEDRTQPRFGWQKVAAASLQQHFLNNALMPTLSAEKKALLRSQSGPFSSAPFVSFSTSKVTQFDSQAFRVLLLRRLHLPLPLSIRNCRCARPLDCLGHHRAACAVARVLGRRRFPLECAAALVCQEAGPTCGRTSWSEIWTFGHLN